MKLPLGLGLVLTVGVLLIATTPGHAQTRRNIKVVLDTQQTESLSRDGLQGSGSVIIRRGTVEPSGRVTGPTVATRVPQSQLSYYRNYALGIGYIDRQIVFTDVGTSLRVHATTLADGQIRLRLMPRISYFSADRPGAIDFTEAATELIVPNGQPVSLGGSTANLHEVTREILGYQNRASSNEIGLVVTATIQN
jgi:hypothetical protein